MEIKNSKQAKTIYCLWGKTYVYCTSNIFKNKKGEEKVVFQISTSKATANKHVLRYRLRWDIEKFFRTCKQSLGLQKCQSTHLKIQFSHASAVFSAYNIIKVLELKYHFDNPEAVITSLKNKFYGKKNLPIELFKKIESLL